MTTTTALSPYPFRPIKSFLAYAVGEEAVELKPEWAGVFTPPTAVILQFPTPARKDAA